MTLLSDIIDTMNDWAPPSTAASYDNVGLQVGSVTSRVQRALVALEVTPAVVDEAVSREVQLVVTHHPLIFKPLRAVRDDDFVGHLVIRLLRSGISLFSAHTNLDAAKGGVSFALAECLQLRDIRMLAPLDDQLVKLAVFVPRPAAAQLHEAMSSAGAGRIGTYEACAFEIEGTGLFRPTSRSNPTIGSSGQLESVDEVRLEFEVERARLSAVVRAMRATHPYEEVAYDVYALDKRSTQSGMGAIGELTSPMVASDFVRHVSNQLEAPGIRYSGDPESPVARVAVCGGSGSGLIDRALSAGADAFVTGDVTYHRHFEALDGDGKPRMVILDAGHYETERPSESLIVDEMTRRHPSVTWIQTASRTNPVRYHVS